MLIQYRFLLTLFLFILEFYTYRILKYVITKRWAKILYWSINTVTYLLFIYLLSTFHIGEQNADRVQWIGAILMIVFVPKLIITLFTFVNDIVSIIKILFKSRQYGNKGPGKRHKYVAATALFISLVFSLIAVDGVVLGKYRFTTKHVKLKIDNLPQNFKGYKIVQISDVHAGSFRNPEKLNHAIDLINAQKPDLVLFTGDMVNNYASEFNPLVEMFAKIEAKDGKYSILGNHDYGGYGKWRSINEKAQNVPRLINLLKKAGFRTLRNESVKINKGTESIFILGVDNWGLPPFPQFGDLEKALENVPQNSTKILMSHDPTHFDEQVNNHPSNIQLTLSGHTHGMQFGIETKSFMWSPVSFKYSKWAGLYEENKKYLYVNRGFGVIGFPGRIGIYPEITVFELE